MSAKCQRALWLCVSLQSADLSLHRGSRFLSAGCSAVAVRPPLSLGRLQFPQVRELCSGGALKELGNSLIFLGLAFLMSRLGPERCPVWTGDSQSPENREAPLLAGRGTPGPLWMDAGHGERLPARWFFPWACGRCPAKGLGRTLCRPPAFSVLSCFLEFCPADSSCLVSWTQLRVSVGPAWVPRNSL